MFSEKVMPQYILEMRSFLILVCHLAISIPYLTFHVSRTSSDSGCPNHSGCFRSAVAFTFGRLLSFSIGSSLFSIPTVFLWVFHGFRWFSYGFPQLVFHNYCRILLDIPTAPVPLPTGSPHQESLEEAFVRLLRLGGAGNTNGSMYSFYFKVKWETIWL